ncbi:MAG: hypothetical protein ACLP5H_30785 [Desulfomonilaceae bacterium]
MGNHNGSQDHENFNQQCVEAEQTAYKQQQDRRISQMNENEFRKEYQELEATAREMKLNWLRITGVADSLFGEYKWPSTIMLIRSCVDAAKEAQAREENPHQAVRQRLLRYLLKEVEKELDKGQYDDAA